MSAPGELVRFGAVGLLSNAALYLFYLAATGLGLGHKLAMTAAWCVGVLQGFFLNRAWTFRSRAATPAALGRYWTAYLAGYALNLGLLFALVDRAGLPHQAVQGALIVLIAPLLFLAQKFWVFRAPA
jgi:putative flippase GtrA